MSEYTASSTVSCADPVHSQNVQIWSADILYQSPIELFAIQLPDPTSYRKLPTALGDTHGRLIASAGRDSRLGILSLLGKSSSMQLGFYSSPVIM
jgi:hypothetical protein